MIMTPECLSRFPDTEKGNKQRQHQTGNFTLEFVELR